ncbi:MAG: hypothetical protein P4L56_18655 [Candidatus Sulfopaludibacter sp.]|nr:hypothetical protein [Candidatus Sulfopaludibacter sp.]
MKTYSAQSGYVYQYYYEGQRPFHSGPDHGIEFVFSLSHDRKAWHSISVMVSDSAIAVWEQAHARALSATERYALAKMALFQAFDERPAPEQMKEPVRLRPADVDGIIESLGL